MLTPPGAANWERLVAVKAIPEVTPKPTATTATATLRTRGCGTGERRELIVCWLVSAVTRETAGRGFGLARARLVFDATLVVSASKLTLT
jgi:hypothetical protein